VLPAEDLVIEVPRWLLPPEAAPGDRLIATPRTSAEGEWCVGVRIDRDATDRARAEARSLLDRLRQRGHDEAG
jgi:hypothetical protein